eukprot:TRINITY_DN12441_c0_g1_i4.p2 TRINITY_DN12441_c0_g1~~TRINITY_DN12441_c0_g1_i4.p2  ORF type:complete len:132 (+),score=23.51 TRINITY_DN12441_c0_g1_i4:219-614(+)
MKLKYFQLIPFFMESKFVAKHFVMKMDLLPESKHLKLEVLKADGLYTRLMDLSAVIPITPFDYREVHSRFWRKPPPFLDLDMVYADHSTRQLLVFDKFGDWSKQGVAHPLLSLNSTYHEFKWFDSFYSIYL